MKSGGDGTLTSIANLAFSEIDLAYTAGFIDADGSIGIYNRHSARKTNSSCATPTMSISNKSKDCLEAIQKSIDGIGKLRCQNRNEKNSNWAVAWILDFRVNEIDFLLPQLLPYLKLKRKQAELIIYAQSLPKRNMEFADIRRNLVDQIKTLNKNGKI